MKQPNARQVRSLGKYVSDIAAEYGLGDWRLTLHCGGGIEPVGPASSPVAAVECVFGRRIATIQFSDDFFEMTPEEQRRIVLHELTHIHQDQWLTLIHDTIPSYMGDPAWHAFEVGHRQAMEHATDAIAAAIADRYPIWEG